MKKSYLAALAALTLSASSIASVSLSGNASVTYQPGENTIDTEAILTITGTSGNSIFVADLDLIDGSLHDVQLATNFGVVGVDVLINGDGWTEVSLHAPILDFVNATYSDSGGDGYLSIELEVSDNLTVWHDFGGSTAFAMQLDNFIWHYTNAGNYDVVFDIFATNIRYEFMVNELTLKRRILNSDVELRSSVDGGHSYLSIKRELASGADLEFRAESGWAPIEITLITSMEF